jgi:hypothetical protein
LISLATSVKAIVGSGVKVTYAADWTEYHHTENGWYNLDSLWASPNIDFIGIDAYFPLTDEVQSGITKQKIKDGWTSGEGYDWYYSDEQRTNKVGLQSEYAWKNIAWWWSNYHTNPNESQTSWVPQSKKIWFTEYGFPSVDGCSNQPNVFYDPESSESELPRFSEGKVDFFAQRMALEATEEAWANSTMIEQRFVWTWDARPYPFYPHYNFIWQDSLLWKYGHWIEGKLGSTLSSDVIYDLKTLTDLNDSDLEMTELYEDIDGLVVNERMMVKEVIEIMQKVNNFDCIETDGKIKFIPKSNDIKVALTQDDIIGEFNVEILNENKIPQRVDITYIDKDLTYEAGNASAERNIPESYIKDTISLPVVLADYKAKAIAEKELYLNWIERTAYKFKVSSEYIYVNSGNIITVTYNDIVHEIRILDLILHNDESLTIYGVRHDSNIYQKVEDTIGENLEAGDLQNSDDETDLEILDLPAISENDLNEAKLYFSVNAKENGWPGCALYSSKDDGLNFDYVNESLLGSNTGKAYSVLGDANTDYFDYKNTLIVKLNAYINMQLESVSEAELFTGKNIAIVGSEIVQFKNAVLNSDGTYTLSCLLRGAFGTEEEITNHTLGERFVLFDGALLSKKIDSHFIGSEMQYKAVAFGDDLSNVTAENFTSTANNLKPLAPVHVCGERNESGDLTTSWKRRARGYSGWRDYIDLPLVEKTELYEIDIFGESNEVVRTIDSITSPTCAYTAVQQTTDFGSVQSSIKMKVYQMSDVVGRGKPALYTL